MIGVRALRREFSGGVFFGKDWSLRYREIALTHDYRNSFVVGNRPKVNGSEIQDALP